MLCRRRNFSNDYILNSRVKIVKPTASPLEFLVFNKSQDRELFAFMHWRRKWQPAPVFLPGESQGRESLMGCRLWGHTESDMTEATQQQDRENYKKSLHPLYMVAQRIKRQCRRLGSISGLGKSPGEGNGYPTPVFLLGNCMDRGVWQATAHGVSKSQIGPSD